ncbi:MAG: hypothetical protein ACK5F7_17790, partial [Planctomycetaceae bacterium]
MGGGGQKYLSPPGKVGRFSSWRSRRQAGDEVERAGVERAAGERVAGERDMRRTEGARAKTAAPIPSPKSRRRPPAAGTARN